MTLPNSIKKNPLYDTSTKNKLGLLKSEFPKSVIGEFAVLAAKCYSLKLIPYHLYETTIYIKSFSYDLSKKENTILYYYTDIESAIFNIDLKDTIFEDNLNLFLYFLINLSILKLEIYYKSKISF